MTIRAASSWCRFLIPLNYFGMGTLLTHQPVMPWHDVFCIPSKLMEVRFQHQHSTGLSRTNNLIDAKPFMLTNNILMYSLIKQREQWSLVQHILNSAVWSLTNLVDDMRPYGNFLVTEKHPRRTMLTMPLWESFPKSLQYHQHGNSSWPSGFNLKP